MIAAREKLGASWRTHGTNVEAIKACPGLADGIDVGGREIGVAIETEVTPPLVIGQDHHHIRAFGFSTPNRAVDQQDKPERQIKNTHDQP